MNKYADGMIVRYADEMIVRSMHRKNILSTSLMPLFFVNLYWSNWFSYSQNQDDKLQGDLSSVDIATKENLENLVKVGEDLLKSPVSRINLDTGGYEPVEDGGTYEEALQR